MSIEKLGRRLYRIQAYGQGKDTNGKYIRHTERLHGTRKEAVLRESELHLGVHQGSFTKRTKMTMADWFLKWHSTYVLGQRAPHTVRDYLSIIINHLIPAFGSLPITSLRPQDIQDFIAAGIKSGRSTTTVRYWYNILRRCLHDAQLAGHIAVNHASSVRRPPSAHYEISYIDIDSIPEFLLAARKSRHFDIIMTALYTGGCQGELLALRWRDIDLDNKTISINRTVEKHKLELHFKNTKNCHRRRLVTLIKFDLAFEVMRRRRVEYQTAMMRKGLKDDSEHLVFAQPDGRLPDTSNLLKGVKEICSAIGHRPVTFHGLRHTHATMLLWAKVHPKVVQERLGHNSVQTTLDTYSHIVPGLLDAMGPPDDHVKYLLKAILPTGVDMLAIIDGEHDENGGEFDA